MSLTDHAEEMLLKLALGTSVGSASAGVYMALGLWENGTYGPWTEAGTGGTEITGGGYARALIPFDGWTAVVSEQIAVPSTPGIPLIGQVTTDNANPIVFGPTTAYWGSPGIFGQLRYGALFDAPTGGNCLAYLGIGSSWAEGIPPGKILTFPAGSLKVRLRGTFYTDTFAPASKYAVGGFTRQVLEYLIKHLTGQATYLTSDRYFALRGNVDHTHPHLGTPGIEVAGGAYARVSTAGLWGAPAGIANGQKIQLTADAPFPTATAAWYPVPGAPGVSPVLVLMDEATGGNLVAQFHFTLQTIDTGERLIIRPADLIPRLIG